MLFGIGRRGLERRDLNRRIGVICVCVGRLVRALRIGPSCEECVRTNRSSPHDLISFQVNFNINSSRGCI